jgi:hypothetical protein
VTEQEQREIVERWLESCMTVAANKLLKAVNEFCKDFKNELDDSLKELEEELGDKPKEEKAKTIWDLKMGETYYHIAGDGEVYQAIAMIRDGECMFEKRKNAGNVFLTKEEAKIELQKREVESLLQNYGGVPFRKLSHKEYNHGYEILLGFNDDVEKYYLFSDVIGNETHAEDTIPFAFESEMELYDAIENIGEDKLIAYACGEIYTGE